MKRIPRIISEHNSQISLRLAMNGDKRALNELFELLRADIVLYAQSLIPKEILSKLDHSDVAQDTLHEAYQAFPKFRGTTMIEFWSWLIAIADNNAKSSIAKFHTKRRDFKKEIPLEGEIEIPVNRLPEDESLQQERESCRQQAFDQLSESDRQIINLRLTKGMSYEDIASMLNEGSVVLRKRYSRAIEKWQKGIKKYQ